MLGNLICSLILILFVFAGCEKEPEPTAFYSPSLSAEQNLKNWKTFNKRYNDKWTVKWNKLTGTPHKISGHYISLPKSVDQENVGDLGLGVIRELREVLQVDTKQLELSKADFEESRHTEAGTGTWYVYFRQVYDGIPVEGGSVRLIIRNNRVTTLASDYFPGIKISPKPRITLQQTIDTINATRANGAKAKPVSDRLIVYPKADASGIRYYLAWDLTMPVEMFPKELVNGSGVLQGRETGKGLREEIPVQWRYLVDAHTGAVIDRINLMVYEDVSGNVTGQILPKTPSDTPETHPIANLTVTITQGMTTNSAETNLTGDFTVGGLSAGPASLEAHFIGPHIQLHNDETPDPDATHSATVSAPGTHDWYWSADDPSPNDVETHTFYHIDYIQSWFQKGAPFDVLAQPDPMQVYVRNGPYCNAGAGAGGLYFGSGTGSCEDFALCADIVYHEYTHRIVAKVYDDASVVLPYEGQSGAMNEAWADYFGSTNTNDSGNGKGCYTGRDIDTPDKRFPDDWVGEVHADGLIFSGPLWDLRTVLGATYVDALAMRAMKQVEVNFSNYLEAVLEEDDDPSFNPDPAADNNLSNGTPNISDVCHSYYDLHGIFVSHCAGHTQGPVAIITTPLPTSTFNLYDSSAIAVPIEGTALGSSTSPLADFVIEYAHQDAPGTWLTAGITLTGGGTSPVTSGLLGSLDLTGLIDGLYLVRLTVTAADASTATTKTSFVLDRALMVGWPQASDVHFYGSPAIADIDLSYPGLEVVAPGWNGNLYVWHTDGTDAPGWPQYVGYSRASPAVADLNGDGSLEIILATYYGNVYGFASNGSTMPGWPKSTSGAMERSTTAIDDLDGDGDLEVVVGSVDKKVYAWHHDGSNVTGWPVTITGEIESSPALGDLTGDGAMEVVVGANDGMVHVWHGDGTVAAGWPQTLTGTPEVSASPALGDLDGDGDLEVVVGTADFSTWTENKAYAWHHDGTLVSGWPKDLTQINFWPSSAGLADLDQDGDLEVIVMSNDDNIHVWQGNGTPVPGWPPAGPGFLGYEFVVSSPSVADIDGDGDMELVAESAYSAVDGINAFNVHAFHHNATPVVGWPKIVSFYSNSSPAIADIDQDGDVEVLIGSNGLFIWDLTGSFDRNSTEWPLYRDDNRRTGRYGPKAGVVLLFDTSGSMSWLPDGTLPSPGEEYKIRINLAKEAVYPFMDLLNVHGGLKVNFGISTFPSHPSTPPCIAEVVTPITLVTTPSTDFAKLTTIPGLITEDNTPLLAGMQSSHGMVEPFSRPAIVLLSDGYHNCPGWLPPGDPTGDPVVAALIEQLQRESVRVFTIGFGKPTDVDHPLLEALANVTTPPGFMGSQFYDVTIPSFDPSVWDPATALQSTYKSILVDVLGLESVTDPLGVIDGGTTRSFAAKLNEHDRRASFYISWKTPQNGRLQLIVKSSDGQPVLPIMSGVTTYLGETYGVLTVERDFLLQPGKVGPNPWSVQIQAGQFVGKENFQYSVIVDSALKLRAALDRESYGTGDTIILTAQVTEAGEHVTGLEEIYVDVTAPEDGIGNWFVKNKVSTSDLSSIPDRQGSERLNTVQRLGRYLTDIRKIPFPGPRPTQTIHLYDDGTHGDSVVNDGIYSNSYSGTTREGVYGFHFRASGPTALGNGFDRDRRIQKYIKINISPKVSLIDILKISIKGDFKRFDLGITPRDALGNYLGPGYSNSLIFQTPQGRVIGKTEDNLDGTYKQVIEVPKSLKARDVNLSISTKRQFLRPKNPGTKPIKLLQPSK